MEKAKLKNLTTKKSPNDRITLEQFVSLMAPLIDMEKDAEISVSMSSVATRSLEAAQKKGSTILNLKCTDAQTGLMGKSLLEFQSNKGDVLPPHRVMHCTSLRSARMEIRLNQSALLHSAFIYIFIPDFVSISYDFPEA